MTTGYPTEATTDAVQANIVAARYDVQRVSLSRVTTFTPGSSQDVTVTFTNTTGSPATGVKLSISAPAGWTAVARPVTIARPGRAGRERERDVQGHLAGDDRRRLPDRQGRVDDPAASGAQSETTHAEGAERPPDQDQRGPLQRRRQPDRPVHRALQRLRQRRRSLQLDPDPHPEPMGSRQAGDDPGRDEARGWRLLPARPLQLRAGRPRKPGRDHHQRQEHHRLRGRPEDRHRRRDPHDRKRRDGGHGHDDAVHSGLHRAVAHDPRRLDQPAGHEREPASRSARRSASTSAATTSWPRSPRSARRPRKRPSSAAAAAGATNIKVAANANMTVGDTLTVGTGGTQGTGQGRERRQHRRERHGRRPGRPAQVRPHVGRRRVRRGDGDQLLAGHDVRAHERRRGAGARQRHHARPPAGQRPRVRRARGQPPGHDGGLPGVRRRPISGSEARSPPGPARSRCWTPAARWSSTPSSTDPSRATRAPTGPSPAPSSPPSRLTRARVAASR